MKSNTRYCLYVMYISTLSAGYSLE